MTCRFPLCEAAAVPLMLMRVYVPFPVLSCSPTAKGLCTAVSPLDASASTLKAAMTSICLPRNADCPRASSCIRKVNWLKSSLCKVSHCKVGLHNSPFDSQAWIQWQVYIVLAFHYRQQDEVCREQASTSIASFIHQRGSTAKLATRRTGTYCVPASRRWNCCREAAMRCCCTAPSAAGGPPPPQGS